MKRRLNLSPLRHPWQWYRYQKALKDIGMALTREGELIIGLILMRHVSLNRDKKAVAPALALASFDFSGKGLRELFEVALKIEAMRQHPNPSMRRAMEEIFEDEDYKSFRRRPLPDFLAAPSHVMLFDEIMRGDDLIEVPYEGELMPLPFVVMFASRGDPVLASAILPRKVAKPVVEFLMQERGGDSSGKRPA